MQFVKKIFALLLLATGTFAAFEKINKYDNNFSDVTENNWFYENVKPRPKQTATLIHKSSLRASSLIPRITIRLPSV